MPNCRSSKPLPMRRSPIHSVWFSCLICAFLAVPGVLHAALNVPAVLQKAEDVHTQMHRRFAPAVVGLTCERGRLPTGQPAQYYGTGAVISADGMILSNTTVIPEGATDIKIYFTDGRVRAATILNLDDASEGVLLKVEEKNLVYMKLADSAQYRPGDPVYSWGNPHFSLQRDGQVSLSLGVVSGQYQVSSVDDQSRYLGPVLETDAAVNPGSDGGPITDADGNLLGIMSLAFSRTRWLGLAIPTSKLIASLPQLKTQTLAPKPTLSGTKAQAWALQKAFRVLAPKAAEATVGLWIARVGDTLEPPASRKEEQLTAEPAFSRQGRARNEQGRPAKGMGSGFLIDPEGTVATSAFLLGGKKKITALYVYLADGTRHEAELLGKDTYYDVAVLKLKTKPAADLPYLAPGKAEGLVTGKSVALLGRSESPGGVTLNPGSISANDRMRQTACQISCLINYGNLGGPVIDLHGKLVGIATHLSDKSAWRQNCGVGFMLKAESLAEVLPKLVAGEKIERPQQTFLGVQGDQGALDIVGARVVRVQPGTAAEEGGVKDGDVIKAFNGKPVSDWISLVKMITDSKVGEVVQFKVERDGHMLDLSITLGGRD